MANRKKSKYQPTRPEMKAALHHLRRLIEASRTLQTWQFEHQVRIRAAAKFVVVMDERMELDAEGAAR